MSTRRTLAVATAVAAGLVALYLLREPASETLAGLTERIEALGAWAPAAYIGIYAVALAVLVPVTPLLLAAGLLFGLVEGALYAFVANSLGGLATFLLARKAARSLVERKLERAEELEALDRAVAKGGLRTAMLIRMSPVLPASLINYGLGLTSIRLGHYLAASLATLPAVVLYTYYGTALGELALLGSGRGPERGAIYYVLLAAGLLATLAVTVALTRRAKSILEKERDG